MSWYSWQIHGFMVDWHVGVGVLSNSVLSIFWGRWSRWKKLKKLIEIINRPKSETVQRNKVLLSSRDTQCQSRRPATLKLSTQTTEWIVWIVCSGTNFQDRDQRIKLDCMDSQERSKERYLLGQKTQHANFRGKRLKLANIIPRTKRPGLVKPRRSATNVRPMEERSYGRTVLFFTILSTLLFHTRIASCREFRYRAHSQHSESLTEEAFLSMSDQKACQVSRVTVRKGICRK